MLAIWKATKYAAGASGWTKSFKYVLPNFNGARILPDQLGLVIPHNSLSLYPQIIIRSF